MGLLLVEVVVSNQWLIYRSLPVVELVEENLRSWSTRPTDRSISAITTTWLSKPGSRQLGAVRAWVRSTKCSSFAISPSVGCNFLPASNLSLFSPSLWSSPSFAPFPPPCPPASSKSTLEKRQPIWKFNIIQQRSSKSSLGGVFLIILLILAVLGHRESIRWYKKASLYGLK